MSLSKLTRFEIFKRDSFTCRYCGKKSPEAILEVDHVIPIAEGAGDEKENLTTACFDCNRGKGARPLTDLPNEPSLHEKTILIAEHELQVAEYNHWKAKQRKREDAQISGFREKWVQKWNRDDSWKESTIRNFLRKLGYDALLDIFEIVFEDTRRPDGAGNGSWSWENSAWRFLCGIGYTRIKGQ